LVTKKPDTENEYLPLTDDEKKVFSVGPAPDYKLSQSVLVNKGYDYVISLECDNGYQKIYHEMTLK